MPGCHSESRGNKDLKFYRLPTEKKPKERQLWARLVRNENLRLDSEWTSVCGLLCRNGRKTYDERTPTIFPWSSEWPKVIADYNSKAGPDKTVRKLKVYDMHCFMCSTLTDTTYLILLMPYNRLKFASILDICYLKENPTHPLQLW